MYLKPLDQMRSLRELVSGEETPGSSPGLEPGSRESSEEKQSTGVSGAEGRMCFKGKWQRSEVSKLRAKNAPLDLVQMGSKAGTDIAHLDFSGGQ